MWNAWQTICTFCHLVLQINENKPGCFLLTSGTIPSWHLRTNSGCKNIDPWEEVSHELKYSNTWKQWKLVLQVDDKHQWLQPKHPGNGQVVGGYGLAGALGARPAGRWYNLHLEHLNLYFEKSRRTIQFPISKPSTDFTRPRNFVSLIFWDAHR